MIAVTLGEIADALSATLPAGLDPASTLIGQVVLDSRAVGPGDLFVALNGENSDGHDYVSGALAAGAVAAVVHDTTRWPATGAAAPLIVVNDTLRALGALARLITDRATGLTVIGITGSNGKTTTKEMLAALLADRGPTIAPEGNLNNEIGVPVTALRVDADTRFLVSEMGARKVGDIRYLTEVVQPSVGVVLNVGTAHLGEFGSRDAIAVAKGELVEALGADDLAVLNADDERVMAMVARTQARVLTFGTATTADVRADADTLVIDAHGCAGFDLVAPTGRARVQLPYVGAHNVSNALAAAAVAVGLGVDVADVAAGLSSHRPVERWRMEVTERADGVTIVNDAYNASPDSMAAALRSLVQLGTGRRTVAVLGEMRELGEASSTEHEQLGRLAVRSGIDVLLVVGAGAAPIHDGALAHGAIAVAPPARADEQDELDHGVLSAAGETRTTKVADRDAAAEVLSRLLRPGDVVLVKSSRDAGLRWLGDDLAAGSAGEASNPSAGEGQTV